MKLLHSERFKLKLIMIKSCKQSRYIRLSTEIFEIRQCKNKRKLIFTSCMATWRVLLLIMFLNIDIIELCALESLRIWKLELKNQTTILTSKILIRFVKGMDSVIKMHFYMNMFVRPTPNITLLNFHNDSQFNIPCQFDTISNLISRCTLPRFSENQTVCSLVIIPEGLIPQQEYCMKINRAWSGLWESTTAKS